MCRSVIKWIVTVCGDWKRRRAENLASEQWYKERCDALDRHVRASEDARKTGAEVPPPWIVFPGAEPWSNWRQGTNEYYMHDLWMPFWEELSRDERVEYLSRTDPPDDWREDLTSPRMMSIGLEPEDLYWRPIWKGLIARDQAALSAGKELEPPWAVVPNMTRRDWSQRGASRWLYYVWTPYYRGLSQERKIAYDAKWNWPEEWRERMDWL